MVGKGKRVYSVLYRRCFYARIGNGCKSMNSIKCTQSVAVFFFTASENNGLGIRLEIFIDSKNLFKFKEMKLKLFLTLLDLRKLSVSI